MAEISFTELICQKFSKDKSEIDEKLDSHLTEFDLTEEYKTEITTNLNAKATKIFDLKDANNFLDFITNVYGKSNIFSFHEIKFENPEGEEMPINKQAIYLQGKLDLSEKKFDFEKNDLFTFGNYENMNEDNYEFTSFKSQNSYLFVKVDTCFAYGIFNSHGNRRMIFKLGVDFFQNPVMDLIGEDEESVKQFFENNSEENVEMLFATSKSYKAYVNELIIYELNN